MTDFIQSFKGDRRIWWIIILLFAWSLLAVFSSTYNLAIREGHGLMYYFGKHLMFVCVGAILIYYVHTIRIGKFKRWAEFGLVVAVGLLLLVFILPNTLNAARGAYRWIQIPIIGNIQPSDIAKIALILYLAKTLNKHTFTTFVDFALRILLPTGVVCSLILIGNMSTAAILGVSCFLMICCSGVNWRYIAMTVGSIVLLGAALFMLGTAFPKALPRLSTAVNRTARFSDESKRDAKSTDFQPEQAKIAVASGGFWGVGAGKSKQVFVLSEAYNDFIFAIIAEEYGVWGPTFIILLYWWLLYRVNIIARKCSSKFPMLLVIGLVLLIVTQALVHIGVSVGAIPVMGQTLPLVSLGGTSLLFMSLAFGIILAVSRAANKQEEEKRLEEAEVEIMNCEL